MTEKPFHPMPNKGMHPAMQFLTLIGLTIGTVIIGYLIAIAIIIASFGKDTLMQASRMDLSSGTALNSLWILQLVSTTLPLLITPFIFAYAIMREPDDYLKTSFHFSWRLILLVFLIMILSSPLMEFISNINQNLNLPQWMRDEEKMLQKASDSMLQMKTIGSMFFNVLFIGLVTALAEEFLFRGCLQTIFVRWFKNKHIAIWVTAVLFSAFHMEFLGFLPRLMLGLFFGYFVAWSGSIWPSIWAHFVNNSTVVVLTYLSQHKLINFNPDNQQVFNNIGYMISFVATIALIFLYRSVSKRWQIADIDGEELD